MDLFSRKIIGWAMTDSMKDKLVVDVLKIALFNRKVVVSDLLLHSDRGSQYASENVQSMLSKHNITCRMSRKGNCGDNAAMESLFHSLKIECEHQHNYLNRQEAKQGHSYLKYMAPVQIEKLNC